ncbi:hypothetical protein PR048_020942 [Dryococelus australis]|uniref:Uncharacterized protein n=1 Tax=Dryococelus australis TaxID=614101 RepID=A0ABQ9GWU4_9NEOP|nr:hypothetical protein PR048_020942 [Dryococelus australis]
MATLGLSKVFILDKYFTELQKFWETEKKLQAYTWLRALGLCVGYMTSQCCRNSPQAARQQKARSTCPSLYFSFFNRSDPRWLSGRNWFNSRMGHPRIFTCRNRAGRCRRWPAGFLWDLSFTPLFHSDADPYASQSPSSVLKTALLRTAQISSLFSTFNRSSSCHWLDTVAHTQTEVQAEWLQLYTHGDRVYTHGARVYTHGDRVYTHGARVYTHGARVYTHGDRVYTHGARVYTHGDRVYTHGDRVYTHGDRVYTHGDRVYTHGARVYTHGDRVYTHGARVYTHGDRVYTHGTRVYTHGDRVIRTAPEGNAWLQRGIGQVWEPVAQPLTKEQSLARRGDTALEASGRLALIAPALTASNARIDQVGDGYKLCRGGRVVRAFVSHRSEWCSIPSGVAPTFSLVANRAGRCRWSGVFSGGSCFPRSSIPTSLIPHGFSRLRCQYTPKPSHSPRV